MSSQENHTEPAEQKPSAPLLLPPPENADGRQEVEVGGSALKLDKLGPMVVNSDGTVSRISNWENMSEIERERTMRVLNKRNQIRLHTLKAAADDESPA